MTMVECAMLNNKQESSDYTYIIFLHNRGSIIKILAIKGE